MKALSRILSLFLALAIAAGSMCITAAAANSTNQIYDPIDISSQVLASRINQKQSGDCAVASMATVEAYMHGATTSEEKDTVYNTLIAANGATAYAYWENCGYVTYRTIDWNMVYNQLTYGYPVIVHRPANGKDNQHWAVVAGYQGSETTLETDKFIIVDVYRNGTKDIYTSDEWRNGVTIDRMTFRKNGLAIAGLTGIRMAINHPAKIHQYGQSHGVYGYVSADSKLTSVQIEITNTDTGVKVYDKTVTPDANAYLLYEQDSAITFGKWAKGKYTYQVVAKTQTQSSTYQYAFMITTGWPVKPETFPDVANTAWYYESVEYAVEKGYFSGYKSGNFGPDDVITRQDFAVVLARIAGVDLTQYSGRTNFEDVAANAYYAKAVKWASATGVIMGYQNGKFGVGDGLTREQLVTILYRFAAKNGADVTLAGSGTEKFKTFADAGKVSGYARDAFVWALENKVISGLNASTLGPQITANRAQVATILMNISKNKILNI